MSLRNKLFMVKSGSNTAHLSYPDVSKGVRPDSKHAITVLDIHGSTTMKWTFILLKPIAVILTFGGELFFDFDSKLTYCLEPSQSIINSAYYFSKN